MPRLFIGIPVCDELRQRAGQLQIPSDAAIRRTPADDFHVTLHFLGETDDATFERIGQDLSSIRSSVFTMILSGVGHFPPSNTKTINADGKSGHSSLPQVLWVGVQPCDALMALHVAVGRVLRSAGVSLEQRPYHPHLTIARVKSATLATVIAVENFEQENVSFEVPQRVNRFVLYSVSRNPLQKPRYVIEREYRLEE